MFDVMIVNNFINQVQELTEILDHEEINLWVCGGPIQALNQMEAHKLDIVFINMNLPCISGIDLAHLMKEKNSNVSVVLMAEDTIAFPIVIELGVDYYVKKPISREGIFAIFEDCLTSRRKIQ